MRHVIQKIKKNYIVTIDVSLTKKEIPNLIQLIKSSIKNLINKDCEVFITENFNGGINNFTEELVNYDFDLMLKFMSKNEAELVLKKLTKKLANYNVL